MSQNLKVVPFERGGDFAYQRAMKSARDNKLADAVELMRKAVEASPENDGYRLELARLLCDAGCPIQSNRMLLDLLGRDVEREKCLYTLAINQLNLNNPESAKRFLDMCLNGSETPDEPARELSGEIFLYESLNRPPTRQLERQYRLLDSGCDRMREGDFSGAVRAFERAIRLDEKSMEARSLLGMAYLMMGNKESAASEAEKVEASEDNSVRSLCVAAQVMNSLSENQRAKELLLRALEMDADPLEERMRIFALFEAGMFDEARERARRALQDTPFDRQLLHIMAVLALRTGEGEETASRYWKRILRIDPGDTIAGYFLDACEEGQLDADELGCEYQVPQTEALERYRYLSGKMEIDQMDFEKAWKEDARFRELVEWSLLSYERRSREAAVTLLASIEDERAESMLREFMLRGDTGFDLTLRAASLYRLRGQDVTRILPPYLSAEDGFLPKGDDVLSGMGVGHIQLVRFASDVLEQHFGVKAFDRLALFWGMYREARGTRSDPLIRTEAASAALAYCYLQSVGRPADKRRIARLFGCSTRQLEFFVRRLSAVFEKRVERFAQTD